MDVQCDAIIKVILSPQENRLASQQGLMDISLIGDGDPSSPDTDKLWRLCGRSHISLADLLLGVQVSADSDRLGLLGWLQEEVRSQCAIVKEGLNQCG
ncbi:MULTISPECIES: hypothetical protein [Pseudanabaena]|uniref:Uncharacterized protein n=2 Tax=Pseudanabaena TaxID=1152 RepID=L8N631_9CYAN|nr:MULTISPECIES: hypothetical protein [Pseudanabaena]ELS34160.1 hypothetical protein Pse7429DRAFT_0642 [Pseudanabaena biceps PCC 7429]MDG3493633.1 hypothetical protein [Pseudanabaena catenata USMAC16]